MELPLDQMCIIIYTWVVKEVEIYQLPSGKEPFTEWLDSLRERRGPELPRLRGLTFPSPAR